MRRSCNLVNRTALAWRFSFNSQEHVTESKIAGEFMIFLPFELVVFPAKNGLATILSL